MKTALITLFLILSIQSFGQLENHRLYKAVEASGQIHVQANTGSLVSLLGAFGSTSESYPDLASVIDLNWDEVVNNADLMILLGAWGNVLWEQSEECDQSTYICFLLDFPGQYAGTSWFPGQPFKMIQTTTLITEWWWVEY